MKHLFKAIPIYPLILFRILFGLLMFYECWIAVEMGWVKNHYVTPSFNFGYIGLEWLKPLPGQGMVYLYVFMALLGLLITVGWRYKLTTLLFFLSFGYSFFSEKTHYLNHHYLIFLFSGLMILLPAHRKLSLDVRRNPLLERETVPQWTLWLLRFQVVLVYFYAGIAKIQPDWLAAKSVSIWMGRKTELYLIGPYMDKDLTWWMISWGGALFDLLIGFALLWPRTRWAAFLIALVFHGFNAFAFHIGVFPYFMIAANLLFFSPEQISRWFFRKRVDGQATALESLSITSTQKVWAANFFWIYLAFQVLFPLRHQLIPGDVNWTEEGHRFSWRMMLRSKKGITSFTVVDPKTNQTYCIDPKTCLTKKQVRELAKHPDMIWQFAQFLKTEYQKIGVENPRVYAKSKLSLNGYKAYPIVDPETDLAAVSYTWGAKDWVFPRAEADTWPWAKHMATLTKEE